jgi:hypothetical protein
MSINDARGINMKFARFFSLMVSLLMPVSSLAQTASNEWFACKSDGECVVVPGSDCYGQTGVNYHYLPDYKKFMAAWQSQAQLCPKPLPDNPNAVPKCINQKCVLAHLSDEELYKKRRQCQSDDECGIKRGGCGDVTANKKYLDKVEPSPYCTKPAGPHDPNSFAKCVDNQCVVRIPGRPE